MKTRRNTLICVLSATLLIPIVSLDSRAQAQGGGPWTLTHAQRRAYLIYYSPVLMLRADENGGRDGRGWITNFDFDRDEEFRNNSDNWNRTPAYINNHPDTANWEIRPTLYTYLVEFMEPDGSKSIILLYHVYHARDEWGIHDWERIEIRVDNVGGDPGDSGEAVRFAVVTNHYEHTARMLGHDDMNFHQTASGNHLMVWQAQHNRQPGTGPDAAAHSLRFVQDPFSEVSARVANNERSRVDATGGSTRKNVHYVFVCEGASDAVDYWDAETLTRSNASDLASGRDLGTEINWGDTDRIRYELQDVADIIPTHAADHPNISVNWQNGPTSIYFDTPILSEGGSSIELNVGLHDLVTQDRFQNQPVTGRNRYGYPEKSWMWGIWDWDSDNSSIFRELMFEGDAALPNRADASTYYSSLGDWWYQHDYFVHSGGEGPIVLTEASPSPYEPGYYVRLPIGRWLPNGWHTFAAGGWDGRWIQLFADDGSDTRPGANDPEPGCNAGQSSTPAPLLPVAALLAGLAVLNRRRRRSLGRSKS